MERRSADETGGTTASCVAPFLSSVFVVSRDQPEEQLFQVVLAVPLAQFGERAFGQDVAAVHDRDPVAEPLGLAHDVRREDDALALVAQLGDRLQQRPGHEHVEAGGRFVEDQHRRIVDDGPGDRDLLLHAGRHLRAEHVANFVHLQPLEDRFHPLAEQLVGHAVEPAEVLDHFPGRHAVVDGGVGRDEADLVPHQRRLREHVEAVDGRRAAGGPEHGAEDAQGGRLARAVGAEQAVDLTRRARRTRCPARATNCPRRRSAYDFVRSRT